MRKAFVDSLFRVFCVPIGRFVETSEKLEAKKSCE